MTLKATLKPRGSKVVSGTVTRLWNDDDNPTPASAVTAFGGVGPVRTQHVEISTLTGKSILIQLHANTSTYRLREGDDLRVRVPNLIQIYQLPNLTDDILSTTSARVGGIVFPEKSPTIIQDLNNPRSSSTDSEPVFEVLTKYNAIVPDSIVQRYQEMRQGLRRQVTFKLLAERIELWPQSEHLMYLSAVLMEVRLVELWKSGELYCMPCESCGEIVFGDQVVGVCPRGQCGKVVQMGINPQVLGAFADETGGLGKGHAVLVAEAVWERMLNGGVADGSGVDETWLREREQMLLYERFTWVLLWTGKWGGGRLILVDVME